MITFRRAKKANFVSYTTRFLCYLLILLPAVLGVLYVRAFGVSVVKGDAWSMVPLFDRWFSGTLQASDFFVQHNEHRSTFPEIAELLLGIATKYNNLAEMYFIQICLLVTLIVLLLAFRANNKSSLGLVLFIPISLLLYSFRQPALMLFGYQINFAFVITFGVLTLFLLSVLGRSSFKKLAFVSALFSATVATYSVVPGLLVWPAGLLQLFIGPLQKSKKRIFIILWSLIGLTEWVTYLRGWSSGEDCSSFIDWSYYANTCQDESTNQAVSALLLHTFEHPLANIAYFLSLLGNSLLWREKQAIFGVLGVGLALACVALIGLVLVNKNRELSERSFWISLMLYSSLILAAITAGRSDGGIETAGAGRYTSFSLLAVVSIYGLLSATALDGGLSIRRRPSVSTILVSLLSGAVLLSATTITYPQGIASGIQNRVSEKGIAYVLATYQSQPDTVVSEIAPRSASDEGMGAKLIRERGSILQKLGYNVFSEPPPDPPSYVSPKKHKSDK